jgi:hypothetical protein
MRPDRRRRRTGWCRLQSKPGGGEQAPINGNRRPSLSADDDGGHFKAQARAYYKSGAITLPR